MPHRFVAPALDGPISGGTLYNRELIAALRRARVDASRLDIEEGRRAVASGQEGTFWVDSLYLDEVPRLAAAARSAQTIGLAVHYLPSLVERPDGVTRGDLRADERDALDAAGVFLTTSPFMRDAIARLLRAPRPIAVVEPGIGHAPLRPGPALHPTAAGMRAILVANLVPGKGIEPFFSALTDVLANRALELDASIVVAGSTAVDPAYARNCEERVRARADLSRAVTFAGALAPKEVSARLAESNLFVSASRMESFGMALAEARAAGLPILACAGGNASFHVRSEAGGELVFSDEALAGAFVRLTIDRFEHAARFERARDDAALHPVRSWPYAATDFIAQLGERPLEG